MPIITLFEHQKRSNRELEWQIIDVVNS